MLYDHIIQYSINSIIFLCCKNENQYVKLYIIYSPHESVTIGYTVTLSSANICCNRKPDSIEHPCVAKVHVNIKWIF